MKANYSLKTPLILEDNWEQLPFCLSKVGFSNRKAVIVTDTNVSGLYLKGLLDVLKPHFPDISFFVFPHGESSKNFEQLQNILNAFFLSNLNRTSLVFALGGGVVGDMAGFAASVYMRGITYIQLPTTLLSMADSSIGGKTGLDFCGTKNLIGSFYSPGLVYANLNTLNSLPYEFFISGLAEIIKCGIIKDALLFEFIYEHKQKIAEKNYTFISEILLKACKIKASIVEDDEKEQGLRKILNYGHTFGHAIESLCLYELPHGHCVSLGFVCAATLSLNSGGLSKKEVKQILVLLDFFGLPCVLPKRYNFNEEDIYSQMKHDKKSTDHGINLIISNSIGTAEIVSHYKKTEIINAIKSITT